MKALTTMIGFGTLMISTECGLVGLGLILTLGVGCSMLSAWCCCRRRCTGWRGGSRRARSSRRSRRAGGWLREEKGPRYSALGAECSS